MAGAEPNAVGAPRLVRYLARRGIAAAAEAMVPARCPGARGPRHSWTMLATKEADLLVMGAYGHGQLSNFWASAAPPPR